MLPPTSDVVCSELDPTNVSICPVLFTAPILRMIILNSICSIFPAHITAPVPCLRIVFLSSIMFINVPAITLLVMLWCSSGALMWISRVHTLTQGDHAGETTPFGAWSSQEQVGDLMIWALPLSYSCTLVPSPSYLARRS